MEKVRRQISPEQEEIIDLIVRQGRSVIVNGYAGFGKTTTALRIAQQLAISHPEKRILILTYNKELQNETKYRLVEDGLTNADCLTFHAYFGNQITNTFKGTNSQRKVIYDDQQLINHLMQLLRQNIQDERLGDRRNLQRRKSALIDRHDLVILDEMQDCTLLFLIYLKKILTPDQQLLVMGDQHQTIYEYNDADNRYFRYINFFFPQDFVCVFANKSMRIRRVQANLINYAVAHGANLPKVLSDNEWSLTRKKIQVVKMGGSVTYLANFCPTPGKGGITKDAYRANWQFVEEWLRDKLQLYKPGQIAILLSNVQDNNPNIKSFLNGMLEQIGAPYTIANQENTATEQENKIVVSTYHQFKGRERECVILFNFSNEAFSQEIYLTDRKIQDLNDVFYVGITRAKEHLLICENTIWHPQMLKQGVQNRFNFLPSSFPTDCQALGIEYHDFYGALFQKGGYGQEDVSSEFDDTMFPKAKLSPGVLPKTTLNLHPSNVAKNLDSLTLNKISQIINDHHLIRRYAGERIPQNLININFVEKIIDEEAEFGVDPSVDLPLTHANRLTENVAAFNSDYVTNEFWLRMGERVYNKKWNWIQRHIKTHQLQDATFRMKVFVAFYQELLKEMTEWLQATHQDDLTDIDDSQLPPHLKLKMIVLATSLTKKKVYLLRQIDNYHWLDQIDLTPLVDRLYAFLNRFDSNKMRAEVPIMLSLKATESDFDALDKFMEIFGLHGLTKLKITGRMDFLVTDRWDNDPSGYVHALIELKCINERRMSVTYLIQTLFYLMLENLAHRDQLGNHQVKIGDGSWLETRKIKFGYLYNVKTNELIVIQNQPAVIDEIFKIIFQTKLTQKQGDDDDDDSFIHHTQMLLNDDLACLSYLETLLAEKEK